MRRYLKSKLGEALEDASEAMRELAGAVPVSELQENVHELYEAFRPDIPRGKQGWDARGTLNLDRNRDRAR